MIYISYDGLNRRTSKAVTNSGDWDCTYNYYYDDNSMVEMRNGSDQVLKQQVWGTQYVDELVQVDRWRGYAECFFRSSHEQKMLFDKRIKMSILSMKDHGYPAKTQCCHPSQNRPPPKGKPKSDVDRSISYKEISVMLY